MTTFYSRETLLRTNGLSPSEGRDVRFGDISVGVCSGSYAGVHATANDWCAAFSKPT
jgi:hypothetical protein